MIIYTCPKCGGDLQEMCLASLPPQYYMRCLACGWSKTRQSSEQVVKILYEEDKDDRGEF